MVPGSPRRWRLRSFFTSTSADDCNGDSRRYFRRATSTHGARGAVLWFRGPGWRESHRGYLVGISQTRGKYARRYRGKCPLGGWLRGLCGAEDALNTIWNTQQGTGALRKMVVDRLLSFVFVIVAQVLLVVSVFFATAAATTRPGRNGSVARFSPYSSHRGTFRLTCDNHPPIRYDIQILPEDLARME